MLPNFLSHRCLDIRALAVICDDTRVLVLLTVNTALMVLAHGVSISINSVAKVYTILLKVLLGTKCSLPITYITALLLNLLTKFFGNILIT